MAERKNSHGDSRAEADGGKSKYCGGCRKWRSEQTWDEKHGDGQCRAQQNGRVAAAADGSVGLCGHTNHKRIAAKSKGLGPNIGKVFCKKCGLSWVVDGVAPTQPELLCRVAHSYLQMECLISDGNEIVLYLFCEFCCSSREIHRASKPAKRGREDRKGGDADAGGEEVGFGTYEGEDEDEEEKDKEKDEEEEIEDEEEETEDDDEESEEYEEDEGGEEGY